MLENGEFWGAYAQNGVIYGAVHGTSTVTGESSFSGSGVDYYLKNRSGTEAVFSGSFTAKASISGTVTSPTTHGTFTGTYDAAYETPASLADAAGTWTGQAVSTAGVQSGSVTIDNAGALHGQVSTCRYTGTLLPRASGKAVFDLTVKFAASGCVFNGETLRGIGLISGQQLVTLALTGDGESGFMAAATK